MLELWLKWAFFGVGKEGERLYGFMKRGAGTHSWSRLHVLIADFLYPTKCYRFFRRYEVSYVLHFVLYIAKKEAIYVLLHTGRRNQPWSA